MLISWPQLPEMDSIGLQGGALIRHFIKLPGDWCAARAGNHCLCSHVKLDYPSAVVGAFQTKAERERRIEGEGEEDRMRGG